MRANGVVVYRGPSRLDGAPIVAIVTGLARASSNPKTGPMAQLWILRADIAPHDAVRSGDDSSVCGDCSLRGAACYVQTYQAPLAVFRAYQAGNYPDGAPQDVSGRMLRLGAYGDPAALPLPLVRRLVKAAAGHTGYSHQWRTAPRGWRDVVMASVETEADAQRAWRAGWRTFRLAAEPDKARERECPSSRGVTCAQCRMCDGGTRGSSITIAPHGAGAKLAYQIIARG